MFPLILELNSTIIITQNQLESTRFHKHVNRLARKKMLINDFTPKQQQILRQLDIGQYAGQTLIAHAPTKKNTKNYYVIHVDVKTNHWRYQPDEPIKPVEVAELLKSGGLRTTPVRHQYVLNSAVFSKPIRRFLKKFIGR